MKAIILAAGIGSRLTPMTLHKPKPLLEIKGRSIFENMITHLKNGGVSEIIVVTGYKHELFDPLIKKYNLKKYILQDFRNNNSAASLQLVIDELECGTLVLNGDLFITKPFFHNLKRGVSQILSQKILNHTPSWGYITDENEKLLDIDTHATSGYGDGVAFFDNKNDLEIIKSRLKTCDPKDYWECCIVDSMQDVEFYAFACESFYTEIDSFHDALQSRLLSPEEIALQCSTNNYAEKLNGITNINYKINFLDSSKVIRIPRLGTESVINRKNEREILELIKTTSIAPQSEFYGSDIKMTNFLEGYHCVESSQIDECLPLLVEKIKALHSFKAIDYPQFEKIFVSDEIRKYENLAKISLTTKQEHKFLLDIARKLDDEPFVLCHRDLQLPNIMFNGSEIKLIDFEYSAFSSVAWELGNLSAELELDSKQLDNLVALYGEINQRVVLEGQLVSSYVWALWGFLYDRLDLSRGYLVRFDSVLRRLMSK